MAPRLMSGFSNSVERHVKGNFALRDVNLWIAFGSRSMRLTSLFLVALFSGISYGQGPGGGDAVTPVSHIA